MLRFEIEMLSDWCGAGVRWVSVTQQIDFVRFTTHRYVGKAVPDRAEALILVFTHKIFRP